MSLSVLSPAGFLLSTTAAAIGVAPSVNPNKILAAIGEGLLHIEHVLKDSTYRQQCINIKVVLPRILDLDYESLCGCLRELKGEHHTLVGRFTAQFQSSQWRMVASQEGMQLYKHMQDILENVDDLRRTVDRIPVRLEELGA